MWPLTRFAVSGDRAGALVVFRNTRLSILTIPFTGNQISIISVIVENKNEYIRCAISAIINQNNKMRV